MVVHSMRGHVDQQLARFSQESASGSNLNRLSACMSTCSLAYFFLFATEGVRLHYTDVLNFVQGFLLNQRLIEDVHIQRHLVLCRLYDLQLKCTMTRN